MKRLAVELLITVFITGLAVGIDYINRGHFVVGGAWTLLFLPVIMEGLKCDNKKESTYEFGGSVDSLQFEASFNDASLL